MNKLNRVKQVWCQINDSVFRRYPPRPILNTRLNRRQPPHEWPYTTSPQNFSYGKPVTRNRRLTDKKTLDSGSKPCRNDGTFNDVFYNVFYGEIYREIYREIYDVAQGH